MIVRISLVLNAFCFVQHVSENLKISTFSLKKKKSNHFQIVFIKVFP